MQVEGEVQALLARRDFLESDVDHLEQYLVAQRERIVEAVASLNDLVQRVPGGLADMRRPLLSAAAEPTGDTDTVSAADDDAADAEIEDPFDVPADVVDDDSGETDDAEAIDVDDADGDDQDEIAEITRVASADEDAPDATPPNGSLFDEDGEPTQQIAAIDPRDPARG